MKIPYIFACWLPSLLTFANACCGLLAMMYTLQGSYGTASLLIILATVLDGCDGRVARYLGTTSVFGLQLDSLADVVSFCVAPALLMYHATIAAVGTVAIVAAVGYLCAGLFRLARFNVTHAEQQRFFIGLPTPAAALCLLAVVLLAHYWHAVAWQLIAPSAIIIVTIGTALLMVSRMQFPAGK